MTVRDEEETSLFIFKSIHHKTKIESCAKFTIISNFIKLIRILILNNQNEGHLAEGAASCQSRLGEFSRSKWRQRLPSNCAEMQVCHEKDTLSH